MNSPRGGAVAERKPCERRPPRLFEDVLSGLPAPAPWSTEGPAETERLTLGWRLERAWERLATGGRVECPLCRGRMSRAAGAGAEPARCADCGSALG